MTVLRSIFLCLSLASVGLSRSGPATGPNELLFYGPTAGKEAEVAVTPSGFTINVMSESEWATLTEADARTYKAIVFGDPECSREDKAPTILGTALNNRAVWSAAITGNVIVLGTDPTYHVLYRHEPGAKDLMEKGISFATEKKGHTGLYMSLSCYYDDSPTTTVQILDQFGTFRVRGKLSCYNKVHIVPTVDGPLKTLSDAVLSNWNCSVHGVFDDMPSNFAPLAIAQDITGQGMRHFVDGSKGVPYVVARGMKLDSCGNGKIDLGEECDDGNMVDGDGCSSVCKMEGDKNPGKCAMCSPYLGDKNQCDATTSCSATPYGTMCACRPGYKAAGKVADTKLQWRLHWSISGHEHRVYVKPGTPCETLCDEWWAGPSSCLEITEKACSI